MSVPIEENSSAPPVDPRIVWSSLLRELDELQRKGRHGTKSFTLTTEIIEHSVIFRWEFTPSDAEQGWNLLGFVREGSFASETEKWSETTNGSLFIDSFGTGTETHRFTEGKTYFFTFFVKRALPFWDRLVTRTPFEVKDSVRFSYRIPTYGEIKALEERLRKLFAPIEKPPALPPPQNPLQRHVNKVIEELRTIVASRSVVLAERNRVIEEVRQSAEFKAMTRTKQNDELGRIEELFDDALRRIENG